MEIKYIKSAARVLNRNCVNKRGLDLFKKVLWVSIGQLTAKLHASKLGDDPIVWESTPGHLRVVQLRLIGRILFTPPT